MKRLISIGMTCAAVLTVAALCVIEARAERADPEVAGQGAYTGPGLLETVRGGQLDVARLPAAETVQQRWVYASMVQGLRRLDDEKTLALIKQWDGCTLWPDEAECPYFDAIHRAKPVREAVVARIREAAAPIRRDKPRVCYCGQCLNAAVRLGDREIVAPILPFTRRYELDEELRPAAADNNVRAVQLLLELKARTDGTNVKGDTALHFAAQTGAIDAARLLLAGGADVNAYPALRLIQRTPVDAAHQAGKVEMEKLLRDAGGLSITELRARDQRP